MKIKTLLQKVRQCETDEDAAAILDELKREFLGKSHRFNSTTLCNEEADLECVRFELVLELSYHYLISIVPEIRDGRLIITVSVNHLLDGLGLHSQDWEPSREATLDSFCPEQTLLATAKLALTCAVTQHQEILEQLGVAPSMALLIAKDMWVS